MISALSALFVIQRFAYKLFAKLDIGLDDWSMLIIFVSGLPSTIMTARGIGPNGIGRDIWTLRFDQITAFGKFFFINEILYSFQVASLKMTLLFFYRRIFPSVLLQTLTLGHYRL